MRLVGMAPETLLPSDTAFRLVVLAIAASAFGILLELLLMPVEKLLLAMSDVGEAPAESWAAAWRTRWRFPIADSEFRRHEALVSFGRVYLLHSVLGGILWAVVVCQGGRGALALLPIAFGLAFASVCYWLWREHTKLIITLVKAAAAWKLQ